MSKALLVDRVPGLRSRVRKRAGHSVLQLKFQIQSLGMRRNEAGYRANIGSESRVDSRSPERRGLASLLLRCLERNVSKIAFGRAVRVLGVDLEPDALHVRGWPVVGLLIVLHQIMRFQSPLIQG